MAPLKVLVVGGGIAGPALAHWLSRIGANITLIERSPQLRASGQQVDLRAQGIPMMKKMGIEAAVRAAAVHEVETQLVDKNGHVRAFFAAAPSGSGKQSITSEYEIMRGDLVRILFDLTEKHQNVKYLYDTTMENFTQDDESDPNGQVHVSFHDGTKEDFDLVVGADGTNSRTRKIMLGPEAPDPRHSLGGNIAYFSIPSRPEDSNVFSMCFLPGPRVSRMIGMRKDCPELARIYMISRGQDEGLDSAYKSGDLAALKKAWGDLYQDGGWQCGRFMDGLRNAPEADDLYSTPLQEVRLPEGSWAKGRVVLVGDAAYSQTAEGYGTTWALVGAYVLAGEIAALHAKEGSAAAVIQGAKNYEKEFRPVATAMHGGPYWIESVLNPRSNLGINLMYGVAKVIAFLKLDQMAAQKGEQSKWQLPQYRELEEGQTEA